MRILALACGLLLILVGANFLFNGHRRRMLEQAVLHAVETRLPESGRRLLRSRGFDHSIGQIETIVDTSDGAYYVVAHDSSGLVFRCTPLGLIVDPDVLIKEFHRLTPEEIQNLR